MITRIEREQVVQRIRARDLSLCHDLVSPTTMWAWQTR